MSEPQWERQVLEKLATAALTEQRRTRQWKLFFRLVWVLLAILLLYGLLRNGDSEGALASTGDHVALLTLSGAISAENRTADRMIAGLQKAYKSSGTRATLTLNADNVIGANGGTGISLGDRCTIEAGLYVTANCKVYLIEHKCTVKASTLSGKSDMLLIRNSETGRIELHPNKSMSHLNPALHATKTP